MCLGIPAKVLSISGDIAKVDFGGVTREVNISLVDAKENDYVIIHAGFVIEKLDPEDAEKIDEIWKDYEKYLDDE